MPGKIFKIKISLFSSFVVFSIFFSLFLSPFFLFPDLAFASATSGTIDGTDKYAWGENIGWLNFGCDNCNVVITDSGLIGNVWSTQYGWINLNPSTSGVVNNGEGVLSGYAWSSNIGWINFAGVTINSNGEFLGYATVKSDNSQINFNCINADSCNLSDFKVKTDWRHASTRSTNAGGSGYMPLSTPTITLPIILNPILNPILSLVDNIGATISSTSNSISNFFKPQAKFVENNIITEVPKIAPLAFGASWDLLPVKAIDSFVFAPLPYEVRIMAKKFPELDRTLKSVGIERLTDVSKLSGVSLNLPGLAELSDTLKNVGVERLADLNNLSGVTLNIPGISEMEGKITNNIGTGKIALIQGLPLAKFSLIDKKNLPSEFVFARMGGELIDLNVALSLGTKGEVNQTISTPPSKMVRLVVKPISKAKSVTGYFVFKSPTPRITQNAISRSLLTASALFSTNDLVENLSTQTGNEESIPIENKLILSSFEYTDPDHDGIYTADVMTPSTTGEHEVITVIDYIDPVLGTRQMRMITVIDPDGYVYEKNNGKETRIPSAVVSLYSLDTTDKKYKLWMAKDYSQENPQITDVRGTYSFLVPEGSYYLEVEAPGYDTYKGKAFVVSSGSGIHQNIEMQSGGGWFSVLDWKTILLIVVLLLLMYNLLKDKLLKFFK